MIIILKKQAEEAKINALKKEMEEQGLGIHESEGVNTRILGLVGDTSVVDMRHIMANSIVENVQRDRKSTRLNSSHIEESRMPSSA